MRAFKYQRFTGGIYFPIITVNIIHKNKFFRVDTLLDSGASTSLFTPDTARQLGIDTKSGKRIVLGGVGGKIDGYINNLELEIAGKKLHAPVVFSENYQVSFNLLGREGIFENFKITFDEKNLVVNFESK